MIWLNAKPVLLHVKESAIISVGKGKSKKKISARPLIGAPFGAIFHLGADVTKPDELSRVERSVFDHGYDGGVAEDAVMRNNMEIYDSNDSQTLTETEIEELRKTLAPVDLVEAIARGNDTFTSKNAFSQIKYLKKKQAKYVIEIKVVETCAAILAEVYYSKKPDSVIQMRPDVLGTIIHQATLTKDTQVLIMDTTIGIVEAGVVERLGGYGRILCPYFTTTAQPTCSRYLNLNEESEASIVRFPGTIISGVVANPMAEVKEPVTDDSPYAEERALRYQSKHQIDQISRWLKQGSRSLIIATEMDPEASFWGLFPLLESGGAFVVYFYCLEPLAKLAMSIRLSKVACNVSLSENWCREYQVLSNRTHPLMMMDDSGGFVLSGIKVTRTDSGDNKVMEIEE